MTDNKNIEIEGWYHLYSAAIFKYICMMTRDYQQAEDLTHETFLRAYNNYDSFERKSETKTWLFRIAHNVTIDFLRRRKPLRIFESFLHNKRDLSPLPEDILDMKEEVRELYKALGSLKPAYREVIILRKIKGFSIKETSDILNWPENK
ncbi:RNA polymerase sigma factor [Anaerobacillus sp. CMMVII]|uniref:RNA polymerase sigma factor n=1 Tax=Anaerobacillus sp. CMMVII TaxID=2755588 RepID=UPI0021B7E8B8|nr:RNA polymerase sigma factor [Anaerobacillus sp. CMMVII]